jgi:hypothetical protein
MKFTKILAIFLLSILIIACDEENNTTQTPPANSNLTLSINGLTDLGASAQYEGWILVNGTPISTGTFTVDGSGTLSQTAFSILSTDLSAATAFILTIEPIPDPSPNPSDVHILAGDFASPNAPLSVGHAAALGNDFSAISGKYILATPTNGSNTDENSGIWFLRFSKRNAGTGTYASDSYPPDGNMRAGQ